MLAQLIQALYNIVDSLFVGQYSESGLTSLSIIYPVQLLMMYRIGRVMEVYGDSRDEAEDNIRHSDKARAAYYRHISGKRWGDEENYDLVVDSSCGVEKTGEQILDFLSEQQIIHLVFGILSKDEMTSY